MHGLVFWGRSLKGIMFAWLEKKGSPADVLDIGLE